MNEVFFRPDETADIHAGKNEEPQANTGNNFFSISTGNSLSQSTKIVLKCKNLMNLFEKHLLFGYKSFPIRKVRKKLGTRNFDSAKVSHLVD